MGGRVYTVPNVIFRFVGLMCGQVRRLSDFIDIRLDKLLEIAGVCSDNQSIKAV